MEIKEKEEKMDKKVKDLVLYIVKASRSESIFLTPDPQFSLSTEPLIDKICEIFAIPKDEMSQFINNDINNDEKKEQ